MHMRKAILFLLAILFFECGLIKAQSRVLMPGTPAANHFSAERLQRVDKLIQQYIDSNWIAGAIAIVAKDGNIVYHKAMGFDDKEKISRCRKMRSSVSPRKQKRSPVLP
jgi:hypothetical protein